MTNHQLLTLDRVIAILLGNERQAGLLNPKGKVAWWLQNYFIEDFQKAGAYYNKQRTDIAKLNANVDKDGSIIEKKIRVEVLLIDSSRPRDEQPSQTIKEEIVLAFTPQGEIARDEQYEELLEKECLIKKATPFVANKVDWDLLSNPEKEQLIPFLANKIDYDNFSLLIDGLPAFQEPKFE